MAEHDDIKELERRVERYRDRLYALDRKIYDYYNRVNAKPQIRLEELDYLMSLYRKRDTLRAEMLSLQSQWLRRVKGENDAKQK